MATRGTGKSAKKPGRIGRLFDYIGGWIEAAERVPVIGGFLGLLIKLGIVLLLLGLAVALLTVVVIIQSSLGSSG